MVTTPVESKEHVKEEGERGVNEHGDDTVESKKHVNQVLSSEDNEFAGYDGAADWDE